MTTRNEVESTNHKPLTRRHASTLLAAVAILSVSLGVAHAESQQQKWPESNQHKLTSDQQKWPEQPGGLQSNQLKVEGLQSNQHKLTGNQPGGATR